MNDDGLLYLLNLAGQAMAALEARVHQLEAQLAEQQSAPDDSPAEAPAAGAGE